MSSVSVQWDSEDARLLWIRLIAPVRWTEVEAAKRDYDRDGFPGQWGVLVDLTEAGELPQISVLRLAQLVRATPAGARGFAIIGSGYLLWAMVPLLVRLCPSLEGRFHVADSEDEARAWLLERLGAAESGA